MTTQDPELSAALGWPGGISDPVLDRKVLLQMVAALRLTSKQALEALIKGCNINATEWHQAIYALRAAMAESGRDWSLLDATQESLREHMAEIHRLRAALAQQAEPVQQVKTCAWRDNLDAIYETECGNLHIVNDGTLEENGMKYCCYCGKEIKDESPT